MDNDGVATEESYPYFEWWPFNKPVCKFNKTTTIEARVTGYVDIPMADEEALKIAVATQGPVSIAIGVALGFGDYKEGVYFDKNCSQTDLKHAMVIVGYGIDEKYGDYWLVKNSYGTSWGDKGYIKMARNKNNNCGIATNASFPLV